MLFMSAVENDKRTQSAALLKSLTSSFGLLLHPHFARICFIRVLLSLSMNPLCPTSMASYIVS